MTTSEFYGSRVYDSEVDFSSYDDLHVAVESPPPVLNLGGLVNRVAVAAMTGVLLFSVGLSTHSITGARTVVVRPASNTPKDRVDPRKAVAVLRRQSALAAGLFERTPHPGQDDPEPDYGF
jgi:hypothetical protein